MSTLVYTLPSLDFAQAGNVSEANLISLLACSCAETMYRTGTDELDWTINTVSRDGCFNITLKLKMCRLISTKYILFRAPNKDPISPDWVLMMEVFVDDLMVGVTALPLDLQSRPHGLLNNYDQFISDLRNMLQSGVDAANEVEVTHVKTS